MKALSIQTARPTIEVCSKKAMIEIKSRHTRRMNIKTVRPRMRVERRVAPANKNWVRTGARMEQEPLEKFIKYLSDSDLKKLLDPNEIMKDDSAFTETMETGTGTHNKALEDKIREQVDAFFDPGHLKIDWTAGEVLIEWEDNAKPEITVTPYEVVIRVKGGKCVKIRVDEEQLPFLKGKKVNKHI